MKIQEIMNKLQTNLRISCTVRIVRLTMYKDGVENYYLQFNLRMNCYWGHTCTSTLSKFHNHAMIFSGAWGKVW